MAELTEEQLLLLDNFMYIQQSTTTGGTVGDIVNDLIANGGVSASSLSGGVKPDQALLMLQEIQNDPVLCNLTVAQSIDTDGVRASCFVDANGDATVAFRGTGGSYEAWRDNLLGEYRDDTPCQMAAVDFIESCCGDYANITVTGHSKGGNLAQYCTVMLGDRIDRCVSYDGQGFCDDFLDVYADEIAAASGKITSICCESDYVNILLNPIAGEIRYLETQPDADAHHSWELYLQNKGLLDDDGRYNATVPQDPDIARVAEFLDALVDKLGTLPSWAEEAIVDTLAADVGLVFSIISAIERREMDWDDLWQFITDQLGAAGKVILPLLQALSGKMNELLESLGIGGHGGGHAHRGGHHSGSTHRGSHHGGGGGRFAGPAIFSIKTDDLKRECTRKWQCLDDAITQVMKDLVDIDLIVKSLSGLELLNIAVLEGRLLKRKNECSNLDDAMREIISKFEEAENEIVSFG